MQDKASSEESPREASSEEALREASSKQSLKETFSRLADTPLVSLAVFGVVWIALINIVFSAAGVFLGQSYAVREYYGATTVFLIIINLIGMIAFYMSVMSLYRMARELFDLLLHMLRRPNEMSEQENNTQKRIEIVDHPYRLSRLGLQAFLSICVLYLSLMMIALIINVFNIFLRI